MAAKDATYGATADPAPAHVQIIAPATLEAGYTFDASYEGVIFPVTVPAGGVEKGQRFMVPFAPPAATEAVAVAVAVPDVADGRAPPAGAWRDDLCDCCRLGPGHPSLWMACCLPPLLAGQVLTRMRMTWLGRRDGGEGDDGGCGGGWRRTFRNMAFVTVAFYTISTLTASEDADLSDALHVNYQARDNDSYTLNSVITSLFNWYLLYLLIQLRATIRHVHGIPEERCLCLYDPVACGGSSREGVCGGGHRDSRLCAAGVPVGWEDICTALWCQPCVLAQMARHTVDYKEKQASWCNDVGVQEWDHDKAYKKAEAGAGEGAVLIV